MTSPEPLSPADVGDRHRRYMALGMLALALIFLAEVAIHFVGTAVEGYVELAEIALALVMLAFMAPMFLWKLRSRGNQEWHLYVGRDGYVADTLSRAHIASWGTTLLVLMLLATFDGSLQGLPPELPVQLAIAVMLGVFSIVFLVLDRPVRDDGLDEDPHA